MNKKYILASLYKIANTLDVSGLHKEASSLTNLMKRLAEDDTNFDPRQKDFPLDTYRAMGPARVDLSKYQEQEAPKYDYTKESLYNSLSDFGKKYVADRNRENPITSYKEFDAAIYHAFQSPNPRISEMMFLSPFEQSQNVFTQINSDVSELLRGMFMIDRGIDNDKTFQSFKGSIFPALKKKMQERPSTETLDLTTGIVPFGRKTTNKSNDYHKLLRRAKSLVKKAAGEYWNQSGAQSSMDNLLRYILNDSFVPDEYSKEANSIMEEAQRLHDELKSDVANMPKLDRDLPKF
jgi:hypothetical protein